jgi:hypothetical protein
MNTIRYTEKKNIMKSQLQSVTSEIAAIKQERKATNDKGLLIWGSRHKCHRLSELVGIRSSLQANIARF